MIVALILVVLCRLRHTGFQSLKGFGNDRRQFEDICKPAHCLFQSLKGFGNDRRR